jgi:hypothetical protein
LFKTAAKEGKFITADMTIGGAQTIELEKNALFMSNAEYAAKVAAKSEKTLLNIVGTSRLEEPLQKSFVKIAKYKTLKEAENINSILVSALDSDLVLINYWYESYNQSTAKRDSDKVKIAWVLFKQEYEKDETGWKKKLK